MRRFALQIVIALLPSLALAASVSSDNFTVDAPSQMFAQQVADAAENYRRELAIEWLGEPLPGTWSRKCPITCRVGEMGAGGATTFMFSNGEVTGWKMTVQGTAQRILDSVLPHEVSHTIFASHFRRPLPRWADEGAATCAEHSSERGRQARLLSEVIYTTRRIPCRNLIGMMDYPADGMQVLTLYAEGYALTDYLVRFKGRREFIAFIATGLAQGWDAAFSQHYGIAVEDLDAVLVSWVQVNQGEVAPMQFAELGKRRFDRRKGGE